MLPLVPAQARSIGPSVGLLEGAEGGVVFVFGLVTFTFAVSDQAGRRLAAVQLVTTRIASARDVASGFGVSETTLWRWVAAFTGGGVAGLLPEAPATSRRGESPDRRGRPTAPACAPRPGDSAMTRLEINSDPASDCSRPISAAMRKHARAASPSPRMLILVDDKVVDAAVRSRAGRYLVEIFAQHDFERWQTIWTGRVLPSSILRAALRTFCGAVSPSSI